MSHSYYSYDIQWFKLHLAGFNTPRTPSNHQLLKEQRFISYHTTIHLYRLDLPSENKVHELILVALFIMNLYQLDKQATKFTIWKY